MLIISVCTTSLLCKGHLHKRIRFVERALERSFKDILRGEDFLRKYDREYHYGLYAQRLGILPNLNTPTDCKAQARNEISSF